MTCEAIFRFETPAASIICQALAPEDDTGFSGRTTGICQFEDPDIVQVSVTASDLSALRAALNTWLRLVQVASEMVDRTQI
ncbi:MAG TPA: KEOPS complex subunit Pcc1 [Methanospirillum sp.]|nr:KEOPS complex subunit Pcc1 [Methanospirillum sp.]